MIGVKRRSVFVPVKAKRRPVETHDLSVRCVKGYSVVVLTGTDALPLDTLVRPSVQDSVTASVES